MYPTRTSPEWRDDMPRTFSPDLPAHVPTIPSRRRRSTVTVLLQAALHHRLARHA